jgi:sugar phosphate permease
VTADVARYRWVILAVAVAAQAATSAFRLGIPSLAPALRNELHLSLPQIGIVLGSVTAGIMLTQIPWGALSDRIGERAVISVGLGGSALTLAGAALAGSYGALLALLFVSGMLGASATGGSGRAVMGWFPRTQRGMALGVRQMSIPLGGALAALSLPLLADRHGLSAAFALLAALALAGAAAAARWMREPPPPAPGAYLVDAPPPLRDRRLWRLSVGSALLVVAQTCLMGFLVLFLHDERGWSVAAAAATLAAVQVASAVARVWAGRWSDGLELRIRPLRRIAMASSVLLVLAVAAMPLPDAAVVPLLLGAMVLSASWNGLSLTAAAELSGRFQAGTAIGVQNTVLSAASTVAPVAFAALATVSWPLAFAVLTVAQAAGVLVLLPLVAEEDVRVARRTRYLTAQRASRDGSCEASPARGAARALSLTHPTRSAR